MFCGEDVSEDPVMKGEDLLSVENFRIFRIIYDFYVHAALSERKCICFYLNLRSTTYNNYDSLLH